MKKFIHRIATIDDIPAIEELMELSITQLLGPLLSQDELEASFDSMGLDDQLIKDQTYFMIFNDDIFVGCGGWSNRETLFGGNHTPNRDDKFLIPILLSSNAAKPTAPPGSITCFRCLKAKETANATESSETTKKSSTVS